MIEILTSLAQSIAVATYVRDNEALRIGGKQIGVVAAVDEPIDLQPMIDSGLLLLTAPESEAENITYVTFAADLRDDGEAVTGAIAAHRHWAIGIDDKRSRNYFAREVPQLQLLSTPELIKHWVERAQPSLSIVRDALRDIQERARYAPGAQHSLRAWWQARI